MTESILVIGANYFGINGYQTVTTTVDGNPLLTLNDVYFNENMFEVSLGFITTVGTHTMCAAVQGLNACFEFIVCTDCLPRIGFTNGFNISSSTASYFPRSPFTLVGDSFIPGEELTIWIDRFVNGAGTVLAQNIEVQPNGRFQVGLTLPSNASYGSHTISVQGSGGIGHGPDQASANVNVVRFLPDRK